MLTDSKQMAMLWLWTRLLIVLLMGLTTVLRAERCILSTDNRMYTVFLWPFDILVAFFVYIHLHICMLDQRLSCATDEYIQIKMRNRKKKT